MSTKKFTVESLINTLRETEVLLVRGTDGQPVCRTLGMADQTYYRLRQMDGGLKVD